MAGGKVEGLAVTRARKGAIDGTVFDDFTNERPRLWAERTELCNCKI
jgi:hypothetical protein